MDTMNEDVQDLAAPWPEGGHRGPVAATAVVGSTRIASQGHDAQVREVHDEVAEGSGLHAQPEREGQMRRRLFHFSGDMRWTSTQPS
jgi:hypothetical protein